MLFIKNKLNFHFVNRALSFLKASHLFIFKFVGDREFNASLDFIFGIHLEIFKRGLKVSKLAQRGRGTRQNPMFELLNSLSPTNLNKKIRNIKKLLSKMISTILFFLLILTSFYSYSLCPDPDDPVYEYIVSCGAFIAEAELCVPGGALTLPNNACGEMDVAVWDCDNDGTVSRVDFHTFHERTSSPLPLIDMNHACCGGNKWNPSNSAPETGTIGEVECGCLAGQVLNTSDNNCYWDCNGDDTFNTGDIKVESDHVDKNSVCCPAGQVFDQGECKIGCLDSSGNPYLVNPADEQTQCHKPCISSYIPLNQDCVCPAGQVLESSSISLGNLEEVVRCEAGCTLQDFYNDPNGEQRDRCLQGCPDYDYATSLTVTCLCDCNHNGVYEAGIDRAPDLGLTCDETCVGEPSCPEGTIQGYLTSRSTTFLNSCSGLPICDPVLGEVNAYLNYVGSFCVVDCNRNGQVDHPNADPSQPGHNRVNNWPVGHWPTLDNVHLPYQTLQDRCCPFEGAIWDSRSGRCYWDCNKDTRIDNDDPKVELIAVGVFEGLDFDTACNDCDPPYTNYHDGICYWDCDNNGIYSSSDRPGPTGSVEATSRSTACCPSDQEWDRGVCKNSCKNSTGLDHLVLPENKGSECYVLCKNSSGADHWITQDQQEAGTYCYDQCSDSSWRLITDMENCPVFDDVVPPLVVTEVVVKDIQKNPITSFYEIGRADRPHYICRKPGDPHFLYRSATDDQGNPYTCPALNDCLTDRNNKNSNSCNCLDKNNEFVAGTFCDYGFISPMRNERGQMQNSTGQGPTSIVESLLSIDSISIPVN